MLLPASGKAKYNLVAHDGMYGEWRRWANGVLPSRQTAPGQEAKDVPLTLTKPATGRGKVVDAQGKAVSRHTPSATAIAPGEDILRLPPRPDTRHELESAGGHRRNARRARPRHFSLVRRGPFGRLDHP
jgi:hypothetical protein